MSTAREKRHLARVGAMSCICCTLLGQQQVARTEVHHGRTGQGGAQRASDFLVIPLCGSSTKSGPKDGCHRGPLGVHGDKTFLRILKCTELDLLAATLERLLEAA